MAHVSIKPITRLLIANRGEIARRIIRTAHDMGISTVAVYADGDAEAPFVHEADMAIALNGRSSAETYLDADKILAACKRSSADAVHPGYGFLSENAGFADAVTRAGITWVGPPPDAIRAMGDKLSAKRLMQAADVPTLPAKELKPGDDFAAAGLEVGYPLLVKASAGGGGRGMRIVLEASELDEAVASARREAGSAFGDDTIFIERWLAASRHVEIQILGDRHGNLVHCFERECSIQRRHQKIIEEAPSPALDDVLRDRMGQAAVAAGQAINYASAGTVEFLVDGQDFWFLEVNTRLQVEHPITEEITGLDLVREQLRVAEGEALGYGQDALSINGHAIEARLYAEDPSKNFLPAPGRVALWEPSTAGAARFDSGIESGSEVSIEFDPMMAKVIVHAPTRREAAARLARVLESTRIQGITTNRDFLVASLRSAEFLRGETTTDFIERANPARTRAISELEMRQALIAIVIEAQAHRRAAVTVNKTISSGWRNSLMPPQRASFRSGEHDYLVSYRARRDGKFDVEISDTSYRVLPYQAGQGVLDLDIDGTRINVAVTPMDDIWFVHTTWGDLEFNALPRFPIPGLDDFQGGLVAPMPGKVLATYVAAGDRVEKGQLLVILEAMKMEHRITAPLAGTITAIHVAEGEQVANGELLVVLDDGESETQ